MPLSVFEEAAGDTTKHKVLEGCLKTVALQNDDVILTDQLVNTDTVALSEQTGFDGEFSSEDLQTVKNSGVSVSCLIAHSSLSRFHRILQVKLDLIHTLVQLREGNLRRSLRYKVAPVRCILKYTCFIVKSV